MNETTTQTPIVLKRSKLRRRMIWDVVSSLLNACLWSCMVYLMTMQSEMPQLFCVLFIVGFSCLAISCLFTLFFYWNYYSRFRFEIDSDGFYCEVPRFRKKRKSFISWEESPEVFSVPFLPFYAVRGRGRRTVSFFPDNSGCAVPPRSWIENTDEVDAMLETVPANSISKTLLKEK